MNLSFLAYIDESADDRFPQSTFYNVPSGFMKRGDKHHINTDKGGYHAIGLGGFTYTDEADLKEQVNTILKELNF